MYPAPSSPWSVHPDTNSHPKLETGTPCSRDPLGPGQAARPSRSTGWATPPSLPASLPPECPRLSQQGPAVWECPRSVAQPPCPATAMWECPRSVGSVAQPPCPAATEGLPGASRTLRSRPWIAPALCALGFSSGFKPLAGLGWVWFPSGFWLALPRVQCPNLPEGSLSTVSIQLHPGQAGTG